MIDRSQVKAHMDVIAADGERLGKVDELDGERIKLTKDSSSDGQHHHVDLADVARVDEHVHLTKTRAALGLAAAAGAAGAATIHNPLPPLRNPAVGGAAPRRNYMLPWLLAGLALLALILALTQCDKDRAVMRDSTVTTQAVTPKVAGAPLRSGTLAYDLDRFLGGKDGLPRTFTFDRINFNSGTANLRDADRSDLDDIARVLAAYPGARAAIVGYTDAQGPAATNRALGGDRARAVIAALGERGIVADRLEARTGGEDNAVASNASTNGRFENRRTELVILDR